MAQEKKQLNNGDLDKAIDEAMKIYMQNLKTATPKGDTKNGYHIFFFGLVTGVIVTAVPVLIKFLL